LKSADSSLPSCFTTAYCSYLIAGRKLRPHCCPSRVRCYSHLRSSGSSQAPVSFSIHSWKGLCTAPPRCTQHSSCRGRLCRSTGFDSDKLQCQASLLGWIGRWRLAQNLQFLWLRLLHAHSSSSWASWIALTLPGWQWGEHPRTQPSG